MTLDGNPTSRIWKQHHIGKAINGLAHARAVLDDHDATMEQLKSPVGLDLMDALEHCALALGWYIPGIGMQHHPDTIDVTTDFHGLR